MCFIKFVRMNFANTLSDSIIAQIQLYHVFIPLFPMVIAQLRLFHYYIIVTKKLKLSNGAEKLRKFHIKQYILSIAYTENLQVKPQLDCTSTPNLTESFSSI